MIQDHVHKKYICKICEETLTPERISSEIPKIYRDYPESLSILNAEIRPVLLPDKKLLLEYPRYGRPEE
jgi:hypothetical protein